MAYTLVVTEGAKLDMEEAYAYYEQQQSGLGERFLSCLEERFILLSEHPEYYSFIDGKQVLRDVVVDKFPYLVIYAIIDEHVRIYAVHPTHKRQMNEY